ncbi:hypothetical protein [Streptomyces sp. JJ36]|uniref:hypothetical protein n=1 Tax=Streptomyces sp. JJ36 TaxID=2736645 RepID=UPI001F484D3B|nr:hypothetical protein [Streptomyces sp. JJ36]MCF6524269.1 hypothetical protein [Streptomyces sp. JJ36]
MRPAAAVLLAGAVVLFGTACEEDYVPEENPSTDASPSATADADKPVDADLGRTLDLGTPTTVSYKRAGDRTGTLQLTADSVEKGAMSDLDEVRLDAEQRAKVPYYVTMTFRNVGEKTVAHPFTPTGLRDARGEEADELVTVDDEVTECVNEGEYELSAGTEQTRCLVFLVAKGQRPSVVTYTADFDKEPVFWKAD